MSATAASQHPPSQAKQGTIRTLARIFVFARSAVPRFILGIVAALLGNLVALAIPQVLGWLVDGPISSGDAAQVWPAATIVIVLGAIEAVLIALRRWFVLTPGTHIEANMRNALYARLQRLPVTFHDRWPSGQLLSRAISDLSLIRRWLSFGLVMFVVNVLTIIGGFAILISWNWVLGTIFLVCSVPLWIFGFIFEGRYSVVARRSQDQAGDLATAVEESVHGIRVLKAFGRGPHALKKFARQAEQLRSTEIEKATIVAQLWLWLLLVPDIAFGVCLVVGVLFVAQGSLSTGDLVAFFATATVLRFPIESIGFLLSMTFDTRTATDRFFEVMDTVNDIEDPPEPRHIAQRRGELVFDDVHFRYADSPERFGDLIDGVDLRVRPGETMALVGLTGCGKTTLTALTSRLYDVTSGSIRVDGVDVRELPLAELRESVAMAFEDATLFSASVRENVLLGRDRLDPDAAEADAVLTEAIELAQAGFVYELPHGVQTRVGEEGLSLSGGQRQRLALARAVAADPSILVLDDPLSALDVDTEARVEAGLRRTLAETTALIVAHRPSTVMLADRVALMQNGRIVDVGSHSELLARNDHYRFVISSLEDEQEEQIMQEVNL